VIGYLKTRDKVITIPVGTAGPLYTVTSKDGKTLAVDLPPSGLAARFPELNGVLNEGIADVGKDRP
jgi:hypothetical protein